MVHQCSGHVSPDGFSPFGSSVPLKQAITLFPLNPHRTVRAIFPHTALLKDQTPKRERLLT